MGVFGFASHGWDLGLPNLNTGLANKEKRNDLSSFGFYSVVKLKHIRLPS